MIDEHYRQVQLERVVDRLSHNRPEPERTYLCSESQSYDPDGHPVSQGARRRFDADSPLLR